jgi:hypothetical protein
VSSTPTAGYLLVCADGQTHHEGSRVPTAETEQCARDAAAFMDEDRDGGPWTCGPHTVAQACR